MRNHALPQVKRCIAREVYNSVLADLADTTSPPRPPVATTIMCGTPGFGINRTRLDIYGNVPAWLTSGYFLARGIRRSRSLETEILA